MRVLNGSVFYKVAEIVFFLAKKSGCFVNLFERYKKSFFYFCMFVLTFLKRSNMKKIILAEDVCCRYNAHCLRR